MEDYSGAVPLRAPARIGSLEGILDRLSGAMEASQNYLFSQQHEDGYWCGELEADTTLESEYILMHTLLGTGDQNKMQKGCLWMLDHQNEDGGWPIFEGGPSEISCSVLAYLALKQCGYTADH